MFFDDLAQIPELAERVGFAIFVVDKGVISPNSNLKTAKTPKDFFLKLQTFVVPVKSENQKIGIDEVRETIEHCKTKQTAEHFVVIEDAGALTAPSQDALLKILEEPREHYHFAIFATSLEGILETVRSRASIFVQRKTEVIKAAPAVDAETLAYAKRLLAVSEREAVALAEELTNTKKFKKPREAILPMVTTAVELAYKSYFITRKQGYIWRMPRLIELEERLKGNGNVKLQIVACLS